MTMTRRPAAWGRDPDGRDERLAAHTATRRYPLRAAGSDEKLEMDLSRVAEVRARVPTLDLRESRQPVELRQAMAEGIVAVEGLKNFIDQAIGLGLDVVVSY